MSQRLQGKRVFMTGSGTGIGRVAAGLFAAEGASVAVVDVNEALAKETVARIEAADSGRVQSIVADVTDEESVEAAVHAVMQTFGGIDVLYNCAGGSIAADAPIDEVDMNVFDHTIQLDLKGTMLCCRHVLPHMREAGGGTIINMGSVAGLRGNFPAHVYSAAKGAVIAFTRSLAGQYSRDNIRTNAICPGVVLTDRVKERFGEQMQRTDTAQAQSVTDRSANRHPFSIGEPVDIAQIALFLASDESRMINGAIIPADGGLTAY